jgi:hypothetical protein
MSNTRSKKLLRGRRWTPRRWEDKTRWVTRSGSSSKGIEGIFRSEVVEMKSLTWVKGDTSIVLVRLGSKDEHHSLT